MAVPYTFGSATSSIPLSQLDSNFATGITLGNTTVYLGNTTTSFGNVSLTNVTISSVSTAITPAQGGTGLITIPANNVILGNGTSNVAVVAPGTSGNVLTSNGTTWSSATISAASVSAAGSTTQVQYNNAGAFAGSANLTFNGTTLTAAGLSGPHNGTVGATTPSTGSFTTLAASSTVSGTGFSTYLASPPAIGGTAPAAGAFTTLTASTPIGTTSGGTGLGGATPFTSGGVVYASSSSALATGSALYFDGTNLGVGTTSPYSNAAFSVLTLGGSSSSKTGLIALATSAGTDSAHIDVFNTQLRISTNGTTNPIVFYTGGGVSEAVRIDSSQNVGIGTSSPAYKLDVLSTGNVPAQFSSSNASNTLIQQTNTNAAKDLIYRFRQNAGAGNWYDLTMEGSTNAFTIDYNDNERLRIDSSGNVGINNSSPAVLATTTQVAIKANSSADSMFVAQNSNGLTTGKFGFQFTGGVDNLVIGSYTNHPFIFQTNNTERARIDTSGNFILNTTSSIAKFNVGAATASSYPTYSNPSSGGYSGGFFASTLNSSDNYLVLLDIGSVCAGTDATNGGSAIRFLTQSRVSTFPVVERARIDQNGNLLVGATASGQPDANYFMARDASGFQANIGHLTGTASGQPYVYMVYGGLGIGSVTQSGTSGVAYNTSSDYRLKNTIAPMTGALAKVAQLKPVTYKWNADGSNGEGFIAHELAEVCPQAVTGEKDAVNEDGSIKPQGIDTSFLVATLTAAIQELKAEFDAYKASHP